MRRMEVIGVAGDRFSLPGCCLRLVGVEAVVKRREKLSGASIEMSPSSNSGTFPYFREVPVPQRSSGDEQGAGTARYALPLSHKHLCFHLSSWAEERGYFGVPEAGKQPQHQPAPKPIGTSPLAAFHQLAQGVDEAPGAPDTMELRKKGKEFGVRCSNTIPLSAPLSRMCMVCTGQGNDLLGSAAPAGGQGCVQGPRRWERTHQGDEVAPASSSALDLTLTRGRRGLRDLLEEQR